MIWLVLHLLEIKQHHQIINKAPLVLVKLNTDPTDDEKFISVTWKFVRHNGTSYVDLSDSEVRLWMGVSSAELECNLFENTTRN